MLSDYTTRGPRIQEGAPSAQVGTPTASDARASAHGLVYPPISDESPRARIGAMAELGRTPRAHVVALPGGLRVKRHTPGPDATARAVPSDDAPHLGGGLRGEVRGFSQDARHRMIARLQAVPWGAQPVLFVTLTWPGTLRPEHADWAGWKHALANWRKRLFYRWPDARGLLWKLELQTRKSGASAGEIAPHYHLAVFWRAGARVPLGQLRAWCAASWNDVLDGDAAHRKAGTDVRIAKNTRGAEMGRLLGYLSKYLGKLGAFTMVNKDTGEILGTGRIWGEAGDVPSDVLGAYQLTDAELATLCERVNAKGAASGGWYLSAISPTWAGWAISGDGQLLTAELLGGLAGVELRDERGHHVE